MKRIFTLSLILASLMASLPTYGQLADGSIGPDFTLTDIEGNEHNLYEVLAEGKTVIVDFFATWCGPCWSFHQTHVLADMFDKYGPDGTDELFVYAIESDSRTNLDCLYGQAGCNDTSIGDWVAGVPYPIIDDRQTFSDYQNNFYPTIMMIFPDRTVEQIPFGERTEQAILDRIASGPQLTSGINPTFLELEVPVRSVCRTVDAAPKYVINNRGEETITSADISVSTNGTNIFEEQWTGEVASWGIVKELEFDFAINENTVLEMRMDNINGDPSKSLVHTSEVFTDVSNQIIVSITTDANAVAHKNRFNMINAFGQNIANEDLDIPNHEYTFNLTLSELNCYVLTLYDEGNDGIDGLVEIKDDQGRLIYNNADFGNSKQIIFNASQNTSTNDILAGVAIGLAPNPASELLNVTVELETSKALNMSVSAIDGSVLMKNHLSQLTAGNNTVQLDVSDLKAGLYLLNLNDGQNSLTKKFIKQ